MQRIPTVQYSSRQCDRKMTIRGPITWANFIRDKVIIAHFRKKVDSFIETRYLL